jgi:hypothetical protein
MTQLAKRHPFLWYNVFSRPIQADFPQTIRKSGDDPASDISGATKLSRSGSEGRAAGRNSKLQRLASGQQAPPRPSRVQHRGLTPGRALVLPLRSGWIVESGDRTTNEVFKCQSLDVRSTGH